jgi:hypothetical protein
MGPLVEGRAWFRDGDRFGYLDEGAEVVVPARYDDAADFHEARAGVRLGARYGFVDPQGREVIPPAFVRVGRFEAGRALVMRADREVWFIDREGAELFRAACQFEECSFYFSAGRARVQRGGRCGYIDLDGHEVVACVYDDAGFVFAHDRARVMRGGRWGFVDREGHEVVPPRYGAAEDFGSGGLGAYARVMLGGVGLVDVWGRELVPCEYVAVGCFREGRAMVQREGYRDRDDAWAAVGFIDESGAEVIPCRYESATDFEGGRAVVTTKGPTGELRRFVIDRDGAEVPAGQ